MKRIVIIGAGYSGILTAKKLAKYYKKDKDMEISIIDKHPFHTMLTELHEVAAGRVAEESIRIDLKKVFAKRRVKVILDTVKDIDFRKKCVMGEKETYPYDRLVIAAGSRPNYFNIPGAEENTMPLWSYEDAIALRNEIEAKFQAAVCTTKASEKEKLLTFYIVGGGFTGVEMAGELAEYVPILCKKYNITRKSVHIYDIDRSERTVSILPEKASNKVQRRLEKMGVSVELCVDVVRVGEDFIELKADGVISRRMAGTVIWTAGIQSANIADAAAKDLQTQDRGRLQTDPWLCAIDKKDVFIVGDDLFYVCEGEQRPVPQMVENCEQSAKIAAKNIIVSFEESDRQMYVYRPKFHGVMVSVGGRYGVAQVGSGKHMVSLASFFAMFVKHFINIVYFAQVLGWNKIISYLKHEFFTVRHHRSFLGGHFSNVTPSFLLVPLRMFLGAVWVFEGVMKIVGGWMSEPKLTNFFGNAAAWYDGIINGASQGAGATEAITAATSAADGVSSGVALVNWNALGMNWYFVSGTDLQSATISDYAAKIDIPILNSMLDQFVLSNHPMQVVVQCIIVIAEIAIGLALIGGLFTFLAAGASLVLQLMFITTTGLYLHTVWMIFASIAVLIGGGRIFGLDYYVMPALKEKWKKVGFVRKWYWYND